MSFTRLMAIAAVVLLLPAAPALADGGHGLQVSGTVGKVVAIPAPPPPKPGQTVVPAYNAKKLVYLGRTMANKQLAFRFRPKVAGRMNVILRLLDRPTGKSRASRSPIWRSS